MALLPLALALAVAPCRGATVQPVSGAWRPSPVSLAVDLNAHLGGPDSFLPALAEPAPGAPSLPALPDVPAWLATVQERITAPEAAPSQVFAGLALLHALEQPQRLGQIRDYLTSQGLFQPSAGGQEALAGIERWTNSLERSPEIRARLPAAIAEIKEKLSRNPSLDLGAIESQLDALFDGALAQREREMWEQAKAYIASLPQARPVQLERAEPRTQTGPDQIPAPPAPAPEGQVSRIQLASYAVFAALFAAVVLLHLAPAVLAGFFSYMALDLLRRGGSRFIRSESGARWASLAVFALGAAGLSWALVHFLQGILSNLPGIAESAVPEFARLLGKLGFQLPFENAQQLGEMIQHALKEHALSLTQTGGAIAAKALEALFGALVAVLAFLVPSSPRAVRLNLFDALSRALKERVHAFFGSFEKVLGAQVAISAINTTLTAAFLLAMGFPHAPFLILATFVLGLAPIVGNLLSNTLIVATGLTLSPWSGVLALVYMVAIHKGEYFLNSKIIGSRIKTPMWLILLSMLVGEALLGLPGVILAPVVLDYVRSELEAIRYPPAG